MKPKVYKLKAKVWLYPSGTAAWHFVTLPKKEGREIKELFKAVTRGWRSLPVRVTLGATAWKTSIFPDKVSDSYFLPLKALVRKREGVEEGDTISFVLEVCP